MSGRSRKSKNFTLPGNPGSAPPPLPLSPAQAGRLSELWLISTFMATLWLHWRSRVDPVGTMRMVVAFGGPLIGKKQATEMFEEDGEDAEDDGGMPTIAMLMAATRWCASLRLPRTQLELWSGPPVRERRRRVPPVSEYEPARAKTGGALSIQGGRFVININDPEFDEPREHDGFRARRSRIGRQLGAERIGLSLWEIPPGEAAYPFHFHLGEEEILVILSGTPTLRSWTGRRKLATGETVRFPRGRDGAHQLFNDGSEPVRVLAVSNNDQTDIVHYPDSGKVGVAERDPQGEGFQAMFRLDNEVGYWEGEQP